MLWCYQASSRTARRQDQAFDQIDQAWRFHRLAHVRIEAGHYRAVAVFFADIGGEGDGRNMPWQIGAARTHRADQIVAIAHWHRDIADQHIEVRVRQAVLGSVHRPGSLHLRAGQHQELHHRFARILIVVDQQDAHTSQAVAALVRQRAHVGVSAEAGRRSLTPC